MSTATLSPSASRVKFRLADGAQPLILLPVSVNDEGPFDFLRNYKVAFDYPNATLSLFPA